MRMKRIFAILIVFVALALTSCGGGEPVTVASTDSAFEGFIIFGADDDVAREAAIELKDTLS